MAPHVRVLLVATLLALQIANSLAADMTERHNPLARYSQASPTPCKNAGFTSDCCAQNCAVFDETSSRMPCFCDKACHMPQFDDCCEDIAQIGCTAHTPSQCPDLPNPANGSVQFSNDARIPGTEARYNCSIGFVLNGSSIRNCQDNCTWDGSMPECHIQRCNSGELTPPKNGRVTFNPVTANPNKPVRTVAIYTCNDGYILDTINKRRRVCQVDGFWSGSKPRCRADSCQAKFTNGCCSDPNVNCNIRVTFDGDRSIECSCSIDCTDDCCPDNGCTRNTCSQANMLPGCCEWDTPPALGNLKGCYVRGNGGCFCDRNCCHFNDCCSDVPKTPNCDNQMIQQSARPGPRVQQSSRPRPSMGDQQSVRTRPTTRVQLARYRERQAKTQQTDDKMIGELAKAMSLQMEYSDPDKRARWEAIVEELKHIQNN